jgi:hypothetical protein
MTAEPTVTINVPLEKFSCYVEGALSVLETVADQLDHEGSLIQANPREAASCVWAAVHLLRLAEGRWQL